MPHWLDQYPVIRTLPKTIDAAEYNRIKLVQLRHNGPLRFALPAMRCIDVILEQEIWICLDSCQNDRPVLAWFAFDAKYRQTLYEPIHCQLNLYHMHAGLIMGDALSAMGEYLEATYSARTEPHRVLPLKKE